MHQQVFRRAHKRRPSAQQLKQDAAERIDIALTIDRAQTGAALWRHVRRCPHQPQRVLRRRHLWIGNPRNPKVEHLGPMSFRHRRVRHPHHIVRLEITVNHAAAMRARHGIGQLRRNTQRQRQREPLVGMALLKVSQRRAFQTFHQDVRRSIAMNAKVKDLHQTRMRHLAGGQRFPIKALSVATMSRPARRQQLERHALSSLGVNRFIDHAHAAPTQLARDLIVAEDLSDSILFVHGSQRLSSS